MADETKAVKHFLVPEHVKLTDEQKEEVLKKYNVSAGQLPRILIDDPAIVELNLKSGDVIIIKRKSLITDEADYYRVVVNG